jgi:flagellar basal body-associated protein FliL
VKKLLSLLKNKKVLAGLLVPLVALGVVYKVALAPKPKPVHKKVDGTLVALVEPFTLNLAGGRYGRVSVSLLLDEGPAPGARAAADAAPPLLPQSDIVRAVITDHLTGIEADRLIDRNGRHELVRQLLADLKKSTDEPVKEVLITDLAVQ